MNYYDFDTSDYAMFSLGEMYPTLAEFARNRGKTKRRGEGRRYKQQSSQGSAVIKPHTRTVKGKTVLVKGGHRTIRQQQRAALANRSMLQKGWDATKGAAGGAWNATKGAAGGAWNLTKGAAGGVYNVARNNPRISAGVAGVGLAGAAGYGAYRFATRKKRRG